MANDSDPGAHWRVGPEETGSRLDRALMRRFPAAERGLVMRLIRKGNVRINGRRARPESRLEGGDTLFIPASLRNAVDRRERRRRPPAVDFPVLYEDNALLAIDKPAGVVVHGGSGYRAGVVEMLRQARGLDGLRLAHRLDRDTSGCLLLVKRLPALRRVAEAFRDRRAEKCYLAWVMGRVEQAEGRLRGRLRKGVIRGGERMVADAGDGKEAITDFRVVTHRDDPRCPLTLLALYPRQGRTHQLRVQLQQAGHPIAGDAKYGTAEMVRRFRAVGGRGMALHAWRLRLPHPEHGRLLELRAPWPERWRRWLDTMEAPGDGGADPRAG